MSLLSRRFPLALATLITRSGVCTDEDAGEAVSVTRRLFRLG